MRVMRPYTPALPTAVEAPAGGGGSCLEDDVLELSGHMVKGFAARVTRFPLYCAFKVWAGYTRRRLATAFMAEVHHRSHLQSVALRAWGQHTAQHRLGVAQRCVWRGGSPVSPMLDAHDTAMTQPTVQTPVRFLVGLLAIHRHDVFLLECS